MGDYQDRLFLWDGSDHPECMRGEHLVAGREGQKQEVRRWAGLISFKRLAISELVNGWPERK